MHLTQTFACTWRHSRSCSRLCQRVLPVLQHLTSAHLSSLVCTMWLVISCVTNIDTRLIHLTHIFVCTWRHSRSCSRLCHRVLPVLQHLTSAHLSSLVCTMWLVISCVTNIATRLIHLTHIFACTWRHSRSCSRLCHRVLPVLQHLTSAHLSSLVCSVCLLISCVINIDTRLSHLTQTFAYTWRHSRSCLRLCHRVLPVFQHLVDAHLSFLVCVVYLVISRVI
jgi:hypothetical protein